MNTLVVGNPLRTQLWSVAGQAIAPVIKSLPVSTRQLTGLMVEWREVGKGEFQRLKGSDPLMRRDESPRDLEIRVTMQASAAHLCSAIRLLDQSGANLIYMRGNTEHWQTSTTAHAEVLQAVYLLPCGAHAGRYGFQGVVSGRILSGGNYDPNECVLLPVFAFSVMDAE